MQLTDQEILQSAENTNGVVELYDTAARHKFGRVGNIASASHRYSDKNKLNQRGKIYTALLNYN